MITQAIMNLMHGLAVSVFGWLHDHLPAAPSFWTDGTAAINSVIGFVPGPVRYFVPIGPVSVAGASLVGLIVVLGTLRLARRVLSLFTGGGGMA